jgi:hypothetical protein
MAGAVGPVGRCAEAWAEVTERVVVNRHSGLAIDGFDPVAYFTDAEAAKGQPDVEAVESGAVWRFRNEGNRAVFLAHPEIYGPRFGGYDPVDVARGKIVAGRPQLWLISGERLYLFSRDDNRSAFAADPDGLLKQASGNWPALLKTLSGY